METLQETRERKREWARAHRVEALAYRIVNREKLREQGRLDYRENLEQRRAEHASERVRNKGRYKIYRISHRAELLVKKKEWYAENRESELVKARDYWVRMQGVRLFRTAIRGCLICGVDLRGTGRRVWCPQCEPEGARVTLRKYYTKIGKYRQRRGNDWNLQKYRAMSRDNHKCRFCGSTSKLVVHHTHKWRYSLSNALSNLVTLCDCCHKRGHSTKVFYWL